MLPGSGLGLLFGALYAVPGRGVRVTASRLTPPRISSPPSPSPSHVSAPWGEVLRRSFDSVQRRSSRCVAPTSCIGGASGVYKLHSARCVVRASNSVDKSRD